MLDPFVTAQFLGVISSTLNGEAVVKGRSLFKDRLGEQVASPLVTLIDDPTNPQAYTATDVDGEGLAARRNVLIEGGVLRQFVHNSYSARRAGDGVDRQRHPGGFAGTPGVGCLALQLAPGTRIAGRADRRHRRRPARAGVQGLHSGVNPISGDFSTGAAGLLIRNGAVGAPVREFTIASTLQRMLLDIVEVGGDVDWLPMRAAGMSLVINDVTMSGSLSARASMPTVASPPAAIGSHPHLATPVAAGRVRVDLHSHTMWSGDSTTTPDELGEAVVESGIDVLCITDHNAIAGAVELRRSAAVPRGRGRGAAHARPARSSGCSSPSGSRSGSATSRRRAAIREQGGVVYVPHPFDPMRRNLAEPALYDSPTPAWSTRSRCINAKTSLASLNRRAVEFAAEFDLAGGAGSDAHVPDAIGSAYVEIADFDDAGRVPRRPARRRRRRPPLGRTAPVVRADRPVRLTFS